MATFQLTNKKKNENGKNIKKIIGWILLGLSTFMFLFSATNLLPFLNRFLLGILGVFIYPLSVLGLLISLALLNNKKYVMPKKYAIFLALSLYFLLAIIQLIVIGNPGGMSYGQYVALNYTKKHTAGGMIIGFLPSSLVSLMGAVATYILLSVALAGSIALFVEAVISLKKTAKQQQPIKLSIKEKEAPVNNPREKANRVKIIENEEKPIDVMLNGNIEEEEKRELTAREKLGLVGANRNIHQSTFANHDEVHLPEETDVKDKLPNGMTMREFLLSPPTVDLDKFRAQSARVRSNNFAMMNSNQTKFEVNENISQLKDEDQTIEDNFEDYTTQTSRIDLTDVNPDEITNEAEDIIRSVVEQEKIERDESFIQDEPVYEEEPEEPIEEIESPSDIKQFIDFGDVDEDVKEIEAQKPIEEKPQPSFDREERGSILRDRRSDESNLVQERRFTREGAIKPHEYDEIDRRKDMVSVPEKKEEKIKPYKYTRPSLDLLTTVSDDLSIFNEETPRKRVALENALESFGIPAKVQNVVIGPTVTRYEIQMPEGISVKRVLSLDADIAYALSAKGIRIEAPVPGRSVVGIEVPNSKIAKVSIKDVLSSKEFTLSPSPLTFALGKDITNGVKVCNLQKMPHLLVAGTTGSGKSVCLNSIIVSILYKAAPDEVKFIMIDPKQVELSMYEGLPHMITPKVITDPTKAVNALQWAVDEMERRFNLISDERVRNIDEYNKIDKVLQNKVKKMPYIVIIFDEFADFMSVAKNEIEDKIRRLAGKARAAGIHLILATQRPSTDVVTGTLKANLPARIAFKVASRIDSEVILGATGAEKLLGYGDMLYKPTDSSMTRIQGCFIDTPETKDFVNFIIENNEEIFDEEAFNAINNPGKSTNGGGGDGNNGVDPLLPQALKICIDNGVASTTMVQRKLSIGYPRAARIVDQMEERGYISSAEGSKQRSVYISIEEFYAIFGDIYD